MLFPVKWNQLLELLFGQGSVNAFTDLDDRGIQLLGARNKYRSGIKGSSSCDVGLFFAGAILGVIFYKKISLDKVTAGV